MKPNQMRERRRRQEVAKAAQSEALQKYLAEGGDPNEVRPELIPVEADRERIERQIRTIGRQAERHPKGSKARRRKVDELLPRVAELCVLERVLAMDPLERAGLTPSDLEAMAHTSPAEMQAKLRELVAGTIGGGDAPRIEIAR